jgi:hypothetical protein
MLFGSGGHMKHTNSPSSAVVAMMILALFAATALAQGQEPPKVQIPQPGVPQVMTMEGAYVRAAYNNEGYAILGYKASNESVGDPWLLLEIGIARVYKLHKQHRLKYFMQLDGILDQKGRYRRKRIDGVITEEIEDKKTFHLLDAERYVLAHLHKLGRDKTSVQRYI